MQNLEVSHKTARMKSSLFLLLLCSIALPALSQKTAYLPRKTGVKKEHERAIITLPDGLIALGSNLANVRIVDSALHVFKIIELGPSAQEIRDLAFCAGSLFAMQSNDSSNVYRISLGGTEQEKINLNWEQKPIFFDGIASEKNILFLIGDPVNNKFCTFRSLDGGNQWEPTPGKISAMNGEAAYAASGQTNQILNGKFYFVSGGLASRLFQSTDFGETWQNSVIPYPSCPTCGPYAMAIQNEKEIMTVGGNYLEPNNKQNNCFYSTDGGKSWLTPKKGPSGYRSCVITANGKYYACGTNGIDISKNGGKTWKKISDQNCLSMIIINNQLIVSLANGGYLMMED